MLEPGYGGISSPIMYDAWFLGRPFIEAAYMGLKLGYYAIQGDPLVKFR